MKYRRIDEKTINCLISQEDLREHGLEIQDLFEKKKEAMEFLHIVVDEAAREVDFHPQGAITSMQISVMPDKSVSLVLSEDTTDAFERLLTNLKDKLGISFPANFIEELRQLSDDERIERLKDYAARLQGAAKHVMENPSLLEKKSADDNGKNTSTGDTKASAQEKRRESARKGYERPATECAVAFGSFRAVTDYCRQWAPQQAVPSSLYFLEKEHCYYLILEKESDAPADEEKYDRAALLAGEFGEMYAVRPEFQAYLKEHGECLWKEKAIEKLAEI